MRVKYNISIRKFIELTKLIMGRLSRKKWNNKDFGSNNTSGVFGLLDVSIKENFRITDTEYDYICGNATDEELELLIENELNFSQKRDIINLLCKYIKYEC